MSLISFLCPYLTGILLPILVASTHELRFDQFPVAGFLEPSLALAVGDDGKLHLLQLVRQRATLGGRGTL